MPLILLTGIPSSGKTKRTSELKDFFENVHKKTVRVVSENATIENSGINKNKLFLDSSQEKKIRGLVKAESQRLVGREDIVIIDAANYIKGYRYELYCMSKTSKTPQCTVHCEIPIETAWEFNCGRAEGDRFTREIFDALTMRYEAPDSRNRWDSPLFVVLPEDPLPTENIYSALFERDAPPPNQSTQNVPLQPTNYCYNLDKTTQDIVTAILSAQKMGLEGKVNIPGSTNQYEANATLNVPQLMRLRRQFQVYMKMHPTNAPSTVGSLFVQFINTSLNGDNQAMQFINTSLNGDNYVVQFINTSLNGDNQTVQFINISVNGDKERYFHLQLKIVLAAELDQVAGLSVEWNQFSSVANLQLARVTITSVQPFFRS